MNFSDLTNLCNFTFEQSFTKAACRFNSVNQIKFNSVDTRNPALFQDPRDYDSDHRKV